MYTMLVKKPEGKKPLGRPRHRWEDNMQIDLKKIREGEECINLSQGRNKLWALVNRYNVPGLEFKSSNNRITLCYGKRTPLRIHQESSNQTQSNSVITS